MIGEQLGNYRVVAQIGKGGMGAVYRAEHVLMGRQAAIKVLLPAFSHQASVVRRLFNEARASARLQHPALVPIHDCGHHAASGSAYLVMDYLEGESLARRLRRVGKLPLPTAVAIARAIADGMAVAHAAGIVHRDLKPGNVFLVGAQDQAEAVRILDFGVAKLNTLDGVPSGLTAAGAVLGTPTYMAPEQARGAAEVDGRADIYALGCLLFTMLAGRPPFPYRSAGELLAAHAHEPPPQLRGLEATVPLALDREITRALAKDPDARQADMPAFAAALAHAVGAETRGARPTRALPTTPGPRAATPAPLPRASSAPRARESETTFGAAARAVALAVPPPPRRGLLAAAFTLALAGTGALYMAAGPAADLRDGGVLAGGAHDALAPRPASEWTPLPPRPAQHAPADQTDPVAPAHVPPRPTPHVTDPDDDDVPEVKAAPPRRRTRGASHRRPPPRRLPAPRAEPSAVEGTARAPGFILD